jgi:hypothetical protein
LRIEAYQAIIRDYYMESVDPRLDALRRRLDQFSESGDASTVLDPAVADEADGLVKDLLPQGGSLASLPADVLEVVAYINLARAQVLPKGPPAQDAQRAALALFTMLAAKEPGRVPAEILKSLNPD